MGARLAERQVVEANNGQVHQAGKMELKHEFIELRAKGWSLRKAARKLKIAKSAAANWQAEMEEEIASAKAIELEALYGQRAEDQAPGWPA